MTAKKNPGSSNYRGSNPNTQEGTTLMYKPNPHPTNREALAKLQQLDFSDFTFAHAIRPQRVEQVPGYQITYTYALVVDTAQQKIWLLGDNHQQTALAELVIAGVSVAPEFWEVLHDGCLIMRVPRVENTEVCRNQECDGFGEEDVVGWHGCVKKWGKWGEFYAEVSYDSDNEKWMVNTAIIDALTPVNARDLIASVEASIAEADRLNALAAATVKRPIDYCAEPETNGVGGGL